MELIYLLTEGVKHICGRKKTSLILHLLAYLTSFIRNRLAYYSLPKTVKL